MKFTRIYHSWHQAGADLRLFWRSELWQLDPGTLPPASALLLRTCRLLDLVARGIRKNDLRVHASGLTYMTLMSLIPFVAIGIWIFKALGLHLQFLEESKTYLADFPPHFQTFINQTLALVEQTNFAQLGLVGASVLVFTAFGLLGKMEAAINKIWGIRKSRPLLRRLINYLSFVILLPLFIYVVIAIAKPLHPFHDFQSKLSTFFALWLCFSFIYSKLPNTQVRITASVASGFFGALLWQLWLLVFITVQPGVTSINVIYGTLSFIPIFLAWLYGSWTIVLLGSEIAYAVQHEASFQLHREGGQISLATQISVATALMIRACNAFHQKDSPLETNEFSREHQVPYRFLQLTLNQLVRGGFLVRSEDHEDLYVLAKDPSLIQVKELVDLFLNQGRALLDFELNAYRTLLLPVTEALGEHLEKSLGGLSLWSLTEKQVNGPAHAARQI